jgi:hypothetical protein
MNDQAAKVSEEALLILELEDIPDLDEFIIEDGKPVDNVFTEKQYRLLTEALYASWSGPGEGRPWAVFANVGLFYKVKQAPLAPDVMLAVDVEQGSDWSEKANRSYFVWLRGSPPAVVIEIVSDRLGGEETHKMRTYARIGVPYYAIFDPQGILGKGILRGHVLHGTEYQAASLDWIPDVGLGLTLWEGEYEGMTGIWLRWCDREGKVMPTGRERSEEERQRADQERARADQERQRADQAEQELERLRAQLRDGRDEAPT